MHDIGLVLNQVIIYFIKFILGGTADVTVHEKVEDGKLKEIHKVSGGPWGGTSINKSILQRIENYVGKEVLAEFRKTQMEDYLWLTREIENWKRSLMEKDVKDTDEMEMITFRMPVSLYELFQQKSPAAPQIPALQQQVTDPPPDSKDGSDSAESFETPTMKTDQTTTVPETPRSGRNKDEDVQIGPDKDKIHIKWGVIQRIFYATINQTVDHVQKLLQKQEMNSVELLLLVGAFSQSPLVRKLFTDTFKPLGKKIVLPDEAGLVVLRGAVLFGQDPDQISTRILRYTYGLNIVEEFKEGKHLPSKKTEIDKKAYCKDVFAVLARQGDSVKVDQRETQILYSPNKESTQMYHDIYVSTKENPLYITDPGCRKIGSFTVTLPKPTGKENEDGCYKQIVTFGKTEIDFKAYAPKKDTVFGARLNFLG